MRNSALDRSANGQIVSPIHPRVGVRGAIAPEFLGSSPAVCRYHPHTPVIAPLPTGIPPDASALFSELLADAPHYVAELSTDLQHAVALALERLRTGATEDR